MIELIAYIFFSVALAIGVIVTATVWAVVVGWIIAGCLVIAVVVGIAAGVLNVWDRIVGAFRDRKRNPRTSVS